MKDTDVTVEPDPTPGSNGAGNDVAPPLDVAARLDIQELYSRYCHTVDNLDGDGWAKCFTREGTFSSSIGKFAGNLLTGRSELAAFASNPQRHMRSRHWNSALLLNHAGDHIAGTCYALLIDVTADTPQIAASVVYHDEIVREEGQWRFRSRRPVRDTQRPDL